MRTAHQVVADFLAANDVDVKDLNDRLDEAGVPEEERNVHEGRYLAHIRDYVEQRGRPGTAP